MSGQSQSPRAVSSHVIALSSRQFEIGCAAGEEARLAKLAELVKDRFQALQAEHGAVGEDRLLLMTALTLADAWLDSDMARTAAEQRAARAEQALAALQTATAPRQRAKASTTPPPAHPLPADT